MLSRWIASKIAVASSWPLRNAGHATNWYSDLNYCREFDDIQDQHLAKGRYFPPSVS